MDGRMILICIVILLIGYGCGLFQTGVIIGKAAGTDLKKEGSGNTGTTNAMRVLGAKSGILVFLGDFLKCFIPCMIIHYGLRNVFGSWCVPLTIFCGLGVILGHMFPFFLKFKGGKGVACACAFGLALDWKMTVICLVIFAILAVATKYVSLGSVIALSSMVVIEAIFLAAGISVFPMGLRALCFVLMVIIAALIVFAHRANIRRLANGNENKFHAHKKD